MNDNLENFKKHPAYKYAVDVVNEVIPANVYIKKACQNFINDLEEENSDYYFDYNFVNGITKFLDNMIVPNGSRAGEKCSKVLAGFQWFFILNSLCWKMADNHQKRRYEKSVLLIARKSGKTFIVGILFIMLMVFEPEFSQFFSVAPKLELSQEVYTAVTKLIKKSPILSKHFKVTRDYILCIKNNNIFKALATSANGMDGKQPTAYVADEVGGLRTREPIDAMASGQMNITNKTGILISTAYPTLNNPMTEEVKYAEEVLDGKKEDKQLFALLYKPDFPSEWKTSDDELLKANPLAYESKDAFDVVKKKRQLAIDMESTRTNFLTKHMNIFVNGEQADTYVTEEDMNDLTVLPQDSFEWGGKDVFVGVDLSESDDNTAVAMSYYDYDTETMYGKTWIFYPTDREIDKQKIERLNYPLAREQGIAFPSGGKKIDYNDIENFILDLEKHYGVVVKGIAYDNWQAQAMASRLSSEGGYNVMNLKQNNQGLYPGTRLLKDLILDKKFIYEENFLLKANFLNARKVTNTNLTYYLNKKKSDGKIDAVAALIDSMALWREDIDEHAEAQPMAFVL